MQAKLKRQTTTQIKKIKTFVSACHQKTFFFLLIQETPGLLGALI